MKPRLEDQCRSRELTAQVQRHQQVRGAAAGKAVTQPATNFLDTELGKPPVFRGEETKWQEWYFQVQSVHHVQRRQVSRTGDSHRGSSTRTDGHDALGRRTDPGLPTPVSDRVLTEDAALRIVQAVHDSNGAEALRLMCRRYNPLHKERMLAKLHEVLQVDLGTDERTYMYNVVQWEQQIHEFGTMSRETSPDIVKRAIITERSPSAVRTHLLVNAETLTRYATVRAAIEAFPAVGRKWEPDHSGPPPTDVDAMTRKGKGNGGKSKGKGKGGKDKEKGNSKGKDREGAMSAIRRLLRTLWQMGPSTKGLLVETWKASEQRGN